MTEEGRKVAELCRGPERQRMLQLCDDIDRLAAQLLDLQRRGLVKKFYFFFGFIFCLRSVGTVFFCPNIFKHVF